VITDYAQTFILLNQFDSYRLPVADFNRNLTHEIAHDEAVAAISELKRALIAKNEENGVWEERWTGDYIFENEWQSFRTKKDRSLELKSVFRECVPRRRKLAVKVVDIFGNDTMTIVEVTA
jgi:hypothetical protein